MKKLLLSVALLPLLALPAFAQRDNREIGKAGFGRQSQQQQQPAAPPAQRPAGREGVINPGGQPRSAQPQPPQNTRNDARRDNDRRDRAGDRRDNDRRDWDRRGNDRRDWGNNRGPRRDYSGFRDYHRAYNAPRRYRVQPYRRPAGFYQRRWSFGEFLPAAFWGASYWLNDFRSYELPPPPYGTVWVRYGNDALLIDRDTGEVISVQYGIFY